MANGSLEERVAALEVEVAELKQAIVPQSKPWWQDWAGAFRGDPHFERAMKLGRQYRESLKPKKPRRRKPKK
jgi:hypothetical protein